MKPFKTRFWKRMSRRKTVRSHLACDEETISAPLPGLMAAKVFFRALRSSFLTVVQSGPEIAKAFAGVQAGFGCQRQR